MPIRESKKANKANRLRKQMATCKQLQKVYVSSAIIVINLACNHQSKDTSSRIVIAGVIESGFAGKVECELNQDDFISTFSDLYAKKWTRVKLHFCGFFELKRAHISQC